MTKMMSIIKVLKGVFTQNVRKKYVMPFNIVTQICYAQTNSEVFEIGILSV